jgi:hypothetical protein
MTAAGSQPVTPMPDPSLGLMDLGVNQGLPVPSGPGIPVDTELGRDRLGRFTEDTSAWKHAGSNTAGWMPV